MAVEEETAEETTTTEEETTTTTEETNSSTDTTTDISSDTTNSGSSSDTPIDVSNYGIFSDGIATIDSLKSDFETKQSTLTDCCNKLKNESVFMGPICDNCVSVFSSVDTKMNSNIESCGKSHTYLVDASSQYQGTDQSVSSLILNGNTQATDLMALGDRANNGDSAAQQE